MPRSPRRVTAFVTTIAAGVGALLLAACGGGERPTCIAGVDPTCNINPDKVPRVGDVLRLNAATSTPCDSATSGFRRGRVVAVTDRTVIVADQANPAGGYTDEEYRQFGVAFDTLVYPVEVRNFGEPTDLDANGRAILFFTSAVNAMTPPSASYVIGGFFYSRDLFPRKAARPVDNCAGSNAGELFYMLVPDPTGTVNGNRRSKTYVTSSTVATLGHEFQHLINASRRLYVLRQTGTDWDEELWLNEGLSHIAEELLFYQAGGLSPAGQPGQSPRARLTIDQLRSGSRLDALNLYNLQNLARLRRYLDSTETYGVYSPNEELPTRGATWSFLRYAADRSGGSDADFFKRLVNGATKGIPNLRAALGSGAVLEDWLRDWEVSNYADGLVPGLDRVFTQPSWIFRDVLPSVGSKGDYPLRTRTLVAGSPDNFSLGGGTTAYLRFAVAPGAAATVRVRTGSGSNALPATLRLAVVGAGAGAGGAPVATYDGPAGADIPVTNAGSAAAEYALVVLNADVNPGNTLSGTVTTVGTVAPNLAATTSLAGPTRVRLAAEWVAGTGDPAPTDGPVLGRLRAASRRELAGRVAGARAAYAARPAGAWGQTVLPR